MAFSFSFSAILSWLFIAERQTYFASFSTSNVITAMISFLRFSLDSMPNGLFPWSNPQNLKIQNYHLPINLPTISRLLKIILWHYSRDRSRVGRGNFQSKVVRGCLGIDLHATQIQFWVPTKSMAMTRYLMYKNKLNNMDDKRLRKIAFKSWLNYWGIMEETILQNKDTIQ